MKRLPSLLFTGLLVPACCLLPAAAKPQGEAGVPASAGQRPNILWLVLEDTSPWAGCYGNKVNAGHTPNIDSIR